MLELYFCAYVDIQTLYAANLSQSIYEALYSLSKPLSDHTFKARVVIQMNVCRADNHVSKVVLCRSKIMCNFREVMVIDYRNRCADLSSRTPPSFARNIASHEIPHCLRAILSVLSIITALKLRQQSFRNSYAESHELFGLTVHLSSCAMCAYWATRLQAQAQTLQVRSRPL